MTLDPQFLDWMFNTVTVENVTSLSTDGYGTRKFATGFSWQCRIEQKSQLVTSREGKEVRCLAALYGPPYDASTGQTAIVIGDTARITLPAGVMVAGSSQPAIMNVEEHRDDTGIFGYSVYLGAKSL